MADPVDLATLPKVELHVHLEGTVSAATARLLAARHGGDPDEVLLLDRPGGTAYPHPFRDFEHFLAAFLATAAQVRTPEDLRDVAAAFAHAQAAQRVRWSEATFTAGMMVARGWDAAAMWPALTSGLAAAPGARVGLILDTPRDEGVDMARRTVALAADALAAGAPVVALGLTGIEGSVHEREYAFLRGAADELGLQLVVHAGETGGPERVTATLDALRPDRVAHGIASVRDPAVLDRVVTEQVVLEVCPSSNITLGIVPDLATHPVRTLVAAGAAVVIGSDDPPFFATTLTDELAHVGRLLGLDAAGHAALQRRALAASAAPADVRAATAAELDAWEAASAAG
jgi:aminodeoxyfutalosine deaminase